MGCYVDPDKVSAGQPDDDEDIEQIEADGRNNEQVHGGGLRCMVLQEGTPCLRGRTASLDHVLRDAGLSDLEAELEQFTMDARRSCLYRKLNSAIMLVEATHDRLRCDATFVLDSTMDWSVFAKRSMSPQLVVVGSILRQDPA